MVWSSSSLPLRCTMSMAVMIMPGVQKPHCRPWCSRKASCIGCSGAPSAANPSMVLTSCPSAITTSVVQAFTALPSRCTTQAPHCEVSQPTWVPVSRRFSRRNCTSRVRGSTLPVTGLPFTMREIFAISTLYQRPDGSRRSGSYNYSDPSYGPIWPGATSPGTQGAMTKGDTTKGDWPSALYCLGEIREKVIGQFLGGAVDQTLAELRQLAADLRLDVVGEQRATVLLGELHDRAALGEAGHPALALAGDLVAVRRVEIAERDLALEARRHRADLHFRHRAKTAVVGLLQVLAAGDAGLQHLGIIELGPHGLARRRKLDFAVHCHGHGAPPGSHRVTLFN